MADQELESSLRPFGFHLTDDFNAFVACANAIHEADDMTREQSAAEVYDFYHQRLPWMPGSRWNDTDSVRFIPRAHSRRRAEPLFDSYAKKFPTVVSPSELLRAEHEPIAWTQRALFGVEPAERLYFEHKILGIPTTAEVVRFFMFLIRERS